MKYGLQNLTIAAILLTGCLLPVIVGLGVLAFFSQRIAPLEPDTSAAEVAKPVSDQQIAKTIVEKLSAEKKAGHLKGFNIELNVDDGTVWLSGRVASEEQRTIALEIARRVKGVKQVVNDLNIDKNPPTSREPAPKSPWN
jgi:hypothetical protein